MATGNVGGANQFFLKLAELRAGLEASQVQAANAVEAGKRAVAAAEKTKNEAALGPNRDNLKKAERAHKNLAASVKLLAECCCDQLQNCDPDFV